MLTRLGFPIGSVVITELLISVFLSIVTNPVLSVKLVDENLKYAIDSLDWMEKGPGTGLQCHMPEVPSTIQMPYCWKPLTGKLA